MGRASANDLGGNQNEQRLGLLKDEKLKSYFLAS